jgi:hypothetical protein
MRHSDLLPKQGCTGELIPIEHPATLPEVRLLMLCADCGTQFESLPGSEWVRVLYPGMRTYH